MANITKDFYFKNLVGYTATSTAAVTSTGIDTAGYDSVAAWLKITTGTTAHTLHAEMCATTATASFVDIEGSEVVLSTASETEYLLEIFRPQKRYVRFVFTPSATVIVENFNAILGKAGSLPVENTVAGTRVCEFHASPSSGTP